MTDATALLLLPRIQVQNANAVSGPLSWGFPAPTAFTGFAHAIERQFTDELKSGFDGIGIVCHSFEPQVFRPAGKRTRIFRLTRNPVGRDGAPPSFVEEGRTHMEVSIILAVCDYLPKRKGEQLAKEIMAAIQGMRLAGGSILPQRSDRGTRAQWWPLDEDLEGQRITFRKFRHRLLPGFALVAREDQLAEHLEELRIDNPKATALDALLDLTRLNYEPDFPVPGDPDTQQWGLRKKPGWLVPLPVGYAGLSDLYGPGEVANTRDASVPFRFVESLYSLGEWVGAHRLIDPEQLLWRNISAPEKGIYRCINRYSDTLKTSTS
ncbi:MAG: type I-F CRISPR-associated protein Csy2 [Pseudohongiellaceae bacterium]